MSEEFLSHKLGPGWIEVIVGCMFSGKTEELIKQLKRAKYAKQPIQVFKPKIDDRYSKEHVASHNKLMFPSETVSHPHEILSRIEKRSQVVGIDEGQFFDEDLADVATLLANKGKRVIIAGLDTDWRGLPFGSIPALMAVAEVVRKQHAICMVCGELASRTQRLIAAEDDILVGSSESYEARCRKHFDPELSTRLSQLKVVNKTKESSHDREYETVPTHQ